MKKLVLGVFNRNGVAKKSGNKYDMSRIAVADPIEPISKEGMAFSGHGFQGGEIELRKEALQKFMGVKFPCVLDLEFEIEPRNGRAEAVCIGFKGQPAEAA